MSRRNAKRNAAMSQRGYISAPDAAKLIGHAQSTLYRWIDDGLIEGVEIAASRYIKVESLIKHLGPDAVKLLGFTVKPIRPS